MALERIWIVTSKGKVGSAIMDLEAPGGVILDRIAQVNADLVAGGSSLSGIVLSSRAWGKLINDPEVTARSGQSPIQKPIESFSAWPDRFKPAFSAILAAIPWVTFHIDDTQPLTKEISDEEARTVRRDYRGGD